MTIDMALRQWNGIYFKVSPGPLPVLAFVFADQAAADAIMRGWCDALGDEDHDEVIRIAIIEGDIPGQPAGYTVHIGPHLDGVYAALDAEKGRPADALIFRPRWLRFFVPHSPDLADFKDAFIHERQDRLTAVGPVREILLNQRYLVKSRILFRDASQIGGESDPDRVVLGAV